ncbi:MAG: Panacea domain-containing protein, partial [Aeromonas sp.]
MPYPVNQVAEAILRAAKREGRSLTPMQLIKLTYIAHGWSLAVANRDLFTDRIEAWKYGPVIPSLYQATKRFGRSPIPLSMVGDPAELAIDEPDAALVRD